MLRKILNTTMQRTLTPLLARMQPMSAGKGDGADKTDEVLNHADVPIVDYNDPDYLPLPEYPIRQNEPLAVRKQRLIYQSRKRGMLENDLILSTFAAKYLKDMDEKLTEQYDQLINGVTNDWDIYYWAIKVKPTPPEHDNEIMRMLKQHVQNEDREQRIMQPNL